MRRRELLVAAAAAALVRPAAALAAANDPAYVLERLIALEDRAALSYRAAELTAVPGLADQEADHAKALRTDLEALGGRAPSAHRHAPHPRSKPHPPHAARPLPDTPDTPRYAGSAPSPARTGRRSKNRLHPAPDSAPFTPCPPARRPGPPTRRS